MKRILALSLLIFVLCGNIFLRAEEMLPAGDGIYIEEARVLFLETFPLQAVLMVKGQLSDPCHSLEKPRVERADNVFRVTLSLKDDSGQACTEVLEPFSIQVPLNIYGLQAGNYQVDINGVMKKGFELVSDNILKERVMRSPVEGVKQ